MDDFEQRLASAELGDQPLRVMIRLLRDSTRAPSSRVWHELIAAARTNDELRSRLEPSTRRFIRDLRGAASRLPGLDRLPATQFDLWLPLLLHLFDGEAMFSIVAPNPEAEDRLLEFVTDLVANSR